jgi:branched-chain amino acid transport system substrate-binding protein
MASIFRGVVVNGSLVMPFTIESLNGDAAMRCCRFIGWLFLTMLSASCADTDVDDSLYENDSDAVAIGLLLPLTGAPSSDGVMLERSALLAIHEINAAGGVNGQRLKLIAADVRSNWPNHAEEIRWAVEQLVAANVVAIIGPGSSADVLLIQPLVVGARVAVIAPTATSPVLSTLLDDGTIWRTTPSDALQGRFLANRIWASGVQTLAIAYRDDVYGVPLTSALREQFLSNGGQVLSEVAIDPDQTEGFETEAAMLFANGTPDGIVLASFGLQSSGIAISLSSIGVAPFPALFGVDANRNLAFLDNAPPLIIGMRGSAPTAPSESANYQYFAERYQVLTGEIPLTFAENAYDTIYLVAMAMQHAGSNIRESVLQQLGPVSRADSANPVVINPGEWAKVLANAGQDLDYQAAGGPVDFDVNGDVSSGTYLWWQVELGPDGLQFVELDRAPFP